ncbi:hypothetical protein EV356DRAFT_439303 [Viridothelium virens]|uniref:Phytanoyl-CoA dioxygenase n=1 Tax=Viridothelium virens TaxID=1048519 RepID=A0A6A6HNJ5_VIRVR|nr:hypothetical protein EV356DRAFT_439303 [Viridothelium virens]
MAAIQQAPVAAHELVVEPGQLPKLRSNYGNVIDSESTGWLKPTPRDTPLEEMRRRFDEDGYVWVKNVIPREVVLDMRQHYFEHMSPTGLLAPNTSPRAGIFNPALNPLTHHGVGGHDLPPSAEQVSLLTSAHSTSSYLAFLKNDSLRAFIRGFTGWEQEVLVVRTLLRHNVPRGLSTGVHYDKLFLRGGSADFLTGWVPIGDCGAEGGGLMYLEGSTALGKKIEAEFWRGSEGMTPEQRIDAFNVNMTRDGQLTHDAEEFGRTKGEGRMRWLTGNFEAGDVVFHNPYMIHGASKNEDPEGRIRLSTDLRFYEEGAALDKRWMSIWRPDDGL